MTCEVPSSRRPFGLGAAYVDPASNDVQYRLLSVRLEPKVMDVLCVLADAAGDVVPRDSLIDEVWGVGHGADERLTRSISLLRKAFREIGCDQPVIETVAKRGYRLLLPVTTAAPSRLLADEPAEDPSLSRTNTAGETVPALSVGALAQKKPREPDQVLVPPARSLWPGWATPIVATIAILVAGVNGIVFFGTRAGHPAQLASPPEPRVIHEQVRLSPFEAVGDAEADRLLARRLQERIEREFAANTISTVIDDTAGGPSRRDIPEFLFRGSVMPEAGGMRSVSADILHGPTNQLLWSTEMEAPAEETGALVTRMGTWTADVTGCAVGWRGQMDDDVPPQALQQVLRICEAERGDSWADYLRAERLTRDLIDTVPEEPAAYAISASWLAFLAKFGAPTEAEQSRLGDRALGLADELERMSPDHPYAPLARALVPDPERDLTEEASLLSEAMEHAEGALMPSVMWAHFLANTGQTREAFAVTQRLVRTHPLNRMFRGYAGALALQLGHPQEAAAYFDEMRQLWPAEGNPAYFEGVSHHLWGDPSVAEAVLSPGPGPGAAFLAHPCAAAARDYRTGQNGVAILRACRGGPDAFPFGFPLGSDHLAIAGYGEEALSLLRGTESVRFRDELDMTLGGTRALFQPHMAPARADPAFMELAHDLGLAAYWLRSGQWPDFCSEDTLPYSCAAEARRLDTPNG